MGSSFWESWDLFGDAYLTGLLCAVMLALVGVVQTAKREVFAGIAAAQASTLGIAIALSIAPIGSDHHSQHGLPWVLGIGFAIIGTVVPGIGRRIGESSEAVCAWVFLCGASFSVLVLAHSPHGLEEVQRLMFSSLIGADRHDVYAFAGLTLLSILLVSLRHRQILLVATDPEFALAVGIPQRRYALASSIWVGILLGCAIHTVGSLFTFSCLVLPPMSAKFLCRTMRAMFPVAALIALGSSFFAFVIADSYDYPPGQMAAGLQIVLVVVCLLLRRRR